MMTQFEQPAFCLDIIKKKAADPNNSDFMNFDERICNDNELNYTCWDIIPKFTPAVTRPIEIGCLILLLVIQLIRNQYLEFDKDSKWSWYAQCFLTFVAILDIAIETAMGKFPWVAAFIRPIFLIAQFRQLRSYVERYVRVMFVSVPIVVLLFLFIFYFSAIGMQLFAGTLQGV